MRNYSEELLKLLSTYRKILIENDTWKSSVKKGEAWSAREELGHLIDSAQNNIRRFINARYENAPHIIYDQIAWVNSSGYDTWNPNAIIKLWSCLNNQLLEIWKRMSVEDFKLQCETGKGITELHSLEWLAEDYITHLLHHLQHITGIVVEF